MVICKKRDLILRKYPLLLHLKDYNTDTHLLDSENERRLDFDLFDTSIPIEEVYKVLYQRLKQPRHQVGKFNVYKPEEAFTRLYNQAVATTRNLVGTAEDVNKQISEITDKNKVNYDEFKRIIFRLLGTITDPALVEFLEDASKLKIEDKLPFLKCVDIINHIWGTSAALMMSTGIKYDIYAIAAFTKYFLKATLTLYNDGRNVPQYAIKSIVEKTFSNFVHINILDKKLLNNPNLDLKKCIRLYAEQDLSSVTNIEELETQVLYIRHYVMFEQNVHNSNKSYLLEMVVQTIVWYLLSNSKPAKLLRFETEAMSLLSILECYNESLLEAQLSFLEG